MQRVFSGLLLGCLLIASAGAQTSQPDYDRLLKSDAKFVRVPLGLCEDYPEESTTLELIRADMELLKRSGIDVLRISFGWDGVEGAEDEYDWLFWDEFVRMAVDDYGITLIPYIAYTPAWNSTNDDPDHFWHYPPKDYEEFGEFVFDLVTRYKDRIKSWELWNEPDIWIFWAGTQEEYAKLLRTGSDAVRRADPTAKVVMGGIAHDPEWLRTLLRDHAVSSAVDVFNMHNYYETWQGLPMEAIADYVNTVYDIVQTYGDGKPIWMAEVGYSSYRSGARVSDSYSARYAYEHTAAYQAVDLVRRLATVLATEKLSAIAWYEVKDLPPVGETIGDVNNRHLGVARANHEPKPAERALRFFLELTAEPMQSIDGEAAVTRPAASESHVHAFEQEDGDVLVFAWLQTHVPGDGPGPEAGDARDERTEDVTITVPRVLTGRVRAFDAVGVERDAGVTVDRRDNVSAIRVRLEGGQVVVLHLAK